MTSLNSLDSSEPLSVVVLGECHGTYSKESVVVKI